MRHFITFHICLILAVVLLCAEPGFAQTDWIKYPGNPVLSWDSWDSPYVCNASVILDNGIYKMWYSGGARNSRFRIGYATSEDGVHWTKYENPVLSWGASGTWDSFRVWGPYVIREGGIYKMWYSGNDGAAERIGYATSEDGITWTKYEGNPVLDVGLSNRWDDAWASFPCVIFDGGIYRMWYSGYDGSVFRIGYATSEDGVHWRRYEGNPVVHPGPADSWYDYTQTSHASVILDNGVYRMWHYGHDGVTGRIGYATSEDGIHWTGYAGNPVLHEGPQANWDSDHVWSPCVIEDDGIYKMWYSGQAGNYDRIGYATSSPPPSEPPPGVRTLIAYLEKLRLAGSMSEADSAKLLAQIPDGTRPFFEMQHLILGYAAAGNISPTDDEKSALSKYADALYEFGVISLADSGDLMTRISNSTTRLSLNEIKLSILEIEPAESPDLTEGEKAALRAYTEELWNLGMLDDFELLHFVDDIEDAIARFDLNKLKIQLLFRYGSPDTTSPYSIEKQTLIQYLEELRDAGLMAPSKCSDLTDRIEQADSREEFKQALDIMVDQIYHWRVEAPRWDVNADGIVDIADLVTVGAHFGEEIKVPAGINADINGDGVSDIQDLTLVSSHFSESYASPPGFQLAGDGRAKLWMVPRVQPAHGMEQYLIVDVIVDATVPISGSQFDVAFDPNALEAAGITEGSLLENSGSYTFWRSPYIDNQAGTIKGAACCMIGPSEPVKSDGVLATITFEVKNAAEEQAISIQNAKLMDVEERPIVIETVRATLDWSRLFIPEKSALLQNYPNPFNPETWIPYQLAKPASVLIDIHDAKGQLVRRLDLGYCHAGIYTSRARAAYWGGRNESGEEAAGGVYFCRLQAGEFSAVRKLVILK